MKNRTTRRAGFTLIEIIVAVALATVVLLGLFAVSGSVMRFQVEGLRKGNVNAWSLSAVNALNRELEAASTLVHPVAGGSDWLVFCDNWSMVTGSHLSGAVSGTVRYYCYDAATQGPDGQPLLLIRRYSVAGACPSSFSPPSSCGSSYETVASGVRRSGGQPLFTIDPDVAGTIRLRFTIGDPAATNNVKNPQYVDIDTRVTLDKAYLNSAD